MKVLWMFVLFAQIFVFAKGTIAVKALKSDFLSVTESESVTNFITTSLAEIATDEKVMAWSDLEEMIKQLGQTAELASFAADESAANCVSDKCFQELGGALGVEIILITDISKVGSSFIINMRLIDLLSASSEARSTLRVKNGIDGVLDGVPLLLEKLGYGKKVDPMVQAQLDREEAEKQRLEAERLENEKLAEAEKKRRQAGLQKQEEARHKKNADAQKKENARLAKIKSEKLKKEQVEQARKQKAVDLAIQEAAMDKADPNRQIRPWVRYTSLGLAVVGGAVAYVGNQSVEKSYENKLIATEKNDFDAYGVAVSDSKSSATLRNIGFGIFGLGAVGFSLSFTF